MSVRRMHLKVISVWPDLVKACLHTNQCVLGYNGVPLFLLAGVLAAASSSDLKYVSV